MKNWTTKELNVLRKTWGAKPFSEVKKALPGRSGAAIRYQYYHKVATLPRMVPAPGNGHKTETTGNPGKLRLSSEGDIQTAEVTFHSRPPKTLTLVENNRLVTYQELVTA